MQQQSTIDIDLAAGTPAAPDKPLHVVDASCPIFSHSAAAAPAHGTAPRFHMADRCHYVNTRDFPDGNRDVVEPSLVPCPSNFFRSGPPAGATASAMAEAATGHDQYFVTWPPPPPPIAGIHPAFRSFFDRLPEEKPNEADRSSSTAVNQTGSAVNHRKAAGSERIRIETVTEDCAIIQGCVVKAPPDFMSNTSHTNSWLKVHDQATDQILFASPVSAQANRPSSCVELGSCSNQEMRRIMQNADFLRTINTVPVGMGACYNAVHVGFSDGNAVIGTAPASVNQCLTGVVNGSTAGAFHGHEHFINAYDHCCMRNDVRETGRARPAARQTDGNFLLPQQLRIQQHLIMEETAPDFDLVAADEHASSVMQDRKLMLPQHSFVSSADNSFGSMKPVEGPEIDIDIDIDVDIDEELETCLFGSCGNGLSGAYLACDEFRIYEFKVRGCMREKNHDWTQCPFAHPGEKARRRDPRLYQYSATPCPDFRKSSCKRGDECDLSHGVFECWLHPSRYRTQLCKDGKQCLRKVCFFAHSPSQLRIPWSSSPSSSAPSAVHVDHSNIESAPTAVDSQKSCYDLHDSVGGVPDGKLLSERVSSCNLYDGSPMRLAMAASQTMEGLPSYYHDLFLRKYHDQSSQQFRQYQLTKTRRSRQDSRQTNTNRNSATQGVDLGTLIDSSPCKCGYHAYAASPGVPIHHQNYHPMRHSTLLNHDYLSENINGRTVKQVTGYDEFLRVRSMPSASSCGFSIPGHAPAAITSPCGGSITSIGNNSQSDFFSCNDSQRQYKPLQRYAGHSPSPGNPNIFQQLPSSLSSSRSIIKPEGFVLRSKAPDLRIISNDLNGVSTHQTGACQNPVSLQCCSDTTSCGTSSGLDQSSYSSNVGTRAQLPQSFCSNDIESPVSFDDVLQSQSQSTVSSTEFGASPLAQKYSRHEIHPALTTIGAHNLMQRRDFASFSGNHLFQQQAPTVSPMAMASQAAHPQLLNHLVSSLQQMEQRTMEIESRRIHAMRDPSKPKHGEAVMNEDVWKKCIDSIQRSPPSDSLYNTNEFGENATKIGIQNGIKLGDEMQQLTNMSNDRIKSGNLDFGWVNELVK